MTIRTRFAPSPTGFLHIGGVRTALFNWLLAHRHGGQFILRIDDTDAERNKPEALQPILDGFRWLGINWDEGPEVGGAHGPYFQSQRMERYKETAYELVAKGHAYPCLATKEELDAERKTADAAKKPYIHRGQLRDASIDANQSVLAEKTAAVRLKVPSGQTLKIKDLIRGEVEWQTDLIGDPVILRPDGRALYNFATVIDDVQMRITHVIRADEHLSNTPVQIVAYQALGVPLPEFAHVAPVAEPGSRRKISKRDMLKFVTPEIRRKLNAIGWSNADIDAKVDLNPVTVAFYRELGYLPAALVNYFARLGWSMDDKSEIIPLDVMIANFSLDRVNNAPASFDPDKLYWVAGEYMRMLSVEERAMGVIPYLVRAQLVREHHDEATAQKIRRVVEACGERLKLFSDILSYGAFFFRAPEYDPAAVKKRVHKEGIPPLLREFVQVLFTAEPFDPPTLEEKLRVFCEAKGVKSGDMIHALRVSTTGITVGPGVFDCLAILGRDEVAKRIGTMLSQPAAGA